MTPSSRFDSLHTSSTVNPGKRGGGTPLHAMRSTSPNPSAHLVQAAGDQGRADDQDDARARPRGRLRPRQCLHCISLIDMQDEFVAQHFGWQGMRSSLAYQGHKAQHDAAMERLIIIDES